MDREILDVYIPTWEVFKNDICPKDIEPTKSDWIVSMIPKSIYSKLSHTFLNEIDYEEDNSSVNMRVVVIDNKCIEWIKKYNREIDYDSFKRYSSMLSDEDCLKLLKDNNLFDSCSLNFISLTLTLEYNEKISVYNSFLSKEIRDGLQNYLENIFGDGYVWVSDRVLGINSAYKMIPQLYEELKQELENKCLIDKSNEDKLCATKATYVELFIPFLIRENIEEQCVFEVGDSLFYDENWRLIARRIPEVLFLDKKELKRQNLLESVKPFKKTKVYKQLIKYWDKSIIINDLFFVADYDLNDYYQEKQDALRRYAELNGLNFIEV